MFGLSKESTADRIFNMVKTLPEKVQKKILSEVEKLHLLQRAVEIDSSIKKNRITEDEIVNEIRQVRKKIAGHYNAKKIRP